MTNPKQTKRGAKQTEQESDSTYFLKLIVVLLLGMLWLRFNEPLVLGSMTFTSLPIGLMIGLILIHKYEHFQIDRKIWFAVLVIAAVVSYFLPTGIIL